MLSPGQMDSQVTWFYLRLCLARAWVHLRVLVMTCAHFGRDQICTQVKASFSLFGHPTQVNASWVMPINGFLASEIHNMSALKWVFCHLRVLVRKLASAFGHPTQVELAPLATTCRSVWPGLYKLEGISTILKNDTFWKLTSLFNKNVKITSLATNNCLHNLKDKLLKSLMKIRIVLIIAWFFNRWWLRQEPEKCLRLQARGHLLY